MWWKIAQYLRHRWLAKTKHSVHSPFVYDFVTNVLPHRPTDLGRRIQAWRREQLRSREILEIEDFGAGYGGQARPIIQKTLKQVIRSSARRRMEGELLGRIVQHYKPRQALELGTNLGFSTLYITGNRGIDLQFISIEGSKQLSKHAAANLERFGQQATLLTGEFGEVLQHQVSWERFKPDFILLDGNHRKQATLDYFHFLLPRVHSQAIIVLDDIYWSPEMAEAWQAIIAHVQVTVSIDLFHLGICFLNRPQAKEHFRLKSSAL